MNLFKAIKMFLNSLTFIDIIFFTAIITLLILIVSLIYFIKINKDVLDNDLPNDKNDNDNNHDNSNPHDNEKDEQKDLNEIVESIALKEDKDTSYDEEEGELLDLEGLTKKLQEQDNEERISCTEYEKDQEEKAIISYDELLKKHNRYAVNYEKEEVLDDLVVKKVNLNDLENRNQTDELTGVQVISYEKEEAFLKALKELNGLLN